MNRNSKKYDPIPSRRKSAAGLLGFTLIELLVCIAIISVLGSIVFLVGKKTYAYSSLAVSANNIRQLASGGMAYLGDNNFTFWPYRTNNPANGSGTTWWYGFETSQSMGMPEGNRDFDPSKGPLANYVPKGFRPDPSFAIGGNSFKPKYRNGYIGVGYNTLLGGGFLGNKSLKRQTQLLNPAEVVVFFTSAQVNTFQKPASTKNPMLEEFYGIDEKEVTVHGRHGGKAMVAYASGNAGFLVIDSSTRDKRCPQANIGRFAPVGNTKYLE